MRDRHTLKFDRRKYLKTAGAGVAAMAGLAGCSSGGDGGGDGSDGSDGGDGGDGGGGSSGDGSDGSDGGGGGDLQTVNQAVVPANMGAPYAMDKWIREVGVLGKEIGYPFDDDGIKARWADHGYDLQFQTTWDDATLFASHQVQLGHTAPIGAVQLGQSQDTVISIFGITLTNMHGWAVKAGGPYDPDNTGSVQASLDKMVEENALVSNAGWASGSLKYQQIIFENRYGYSMTQENGDFNVQPSDYSAIPDLITNDQIAMGVMLPLAGRGYQELAVDESIKMLFWDYNVFQEEGWGIPVLQTPSTHKSFLEENPEAVRLMLEDWNKGQELYMENAEAIAADEESWDMIGAETEAEAQWLTDLYVSADAGIDRPTLLYPVALDDDRIEAIKSGIELAAEIGTVPSNWDDYVEFVHMDDILEDTTPAPLDT